MYLTLGDNFIIAKAEVRTVEFSTGQPDKRYKPCYAIIINEKFHFPFKTKEEWAAEAYRIKAALM